MDNICTTRLYKGEDNRSLHDSHRTFIDGRRSTGNPIYRKNLHRRRPYPLPRSCGQDKTTRKRAKQTLTQITKTPCLFSPVYDRPDYFFSRRPCKHTYKKQSFRTNNMGGTRDFLQHSCVQTHIDEEPGPRDNP